MKSIPILFLAISSLLLATAFSQDTASGVEWYVGVGGQRNGPFTQAQIASQVRAGTVTAKSLVWNKGLAGWEEAGSNAALAPLFAAPKTMPPAGGAPPSLPGPGGNAANPAGASGGIPIPDYVKNASQDPIPVDELTLEKLKSIFTNASFQTEAIVLDNGEVDEGGFIAIDPSGNKNIIQAGNPAEVPPLPVVFIRGFFQKPGTTEAQRKEFQALLADRMVVASPEGGDIIFMHPVYVYGTVTAQNILTNYFYYGFSLDDAMSRIPPEKMILQ